MSVKVTSVNTEPMAYKPSASSPSALAAFDTSAFFSVAPSTENTPPVSDPPMLKPTAFAFPNKRKMHEKKSCFGAFS